jgi:hypothetical protein
MILLSGIPFVHPFKVGDRVKDVRDPWKPPFTVTENTVRGFKYEYDNPVPFIPRWGMSFLGGEVYLDMPESSHWKFEKVEEHPDFSVSP